MQTTITIELKIDVDKSRVKVVRQAARTAARTLLTVASLAASNRQPSIAVHSNDFFDGENEINLDIDQDEPEEEEVQE